MDCFGLWMDGLCLAGQSVTHLLFTGRLTGKRPRIWHFAAYFSLLCAVDLAARRLFPSYSLPALAAGVFILYGISRFCWGNRRPAAFLAAVLAFYITQLSFGAVNSAETALLPGFIGGGALHPLLAAFLAVYFLLCAGCCWAVLKLLSLAEGETPYIGLVLLPGLFFFAAELYILRTAYGFSVYSLMPREAGKQAALLALQAMGLAAMLCALYSYRRLCQGFRAQAALRSLTQAAQAQKIYVAEAQARCERTRAFRHDVKNHLSVLDGLLRDGRIAEGRAYLGKLETASASLSLPCRTGNPVVDILLGEKLGPAQAAGIETEVSVNLPRPCGIDDFDLCVIFANALDNAVAACQSHAGESAIRVSGRRQGDLYLLTFTNTCEEGLLPPEGTGLANIRSAAEKYRGAVLAEKEGGWFSLRVLLNIP